jgi:hypothetical protein
MITHYNFSKITPLTDIYKMVGDDGIEPPQADSKSAALPLCKSPVENYFFFLDFTEHPFTLVELILIVLPLFVFLLCVFL